MKHSVKTKLITITLAVFAAAAVLFSLISYSAAKHSAEIVVTSLINQSAASAADALSGRIEAVTAVADDLSQDLALSRASDDFRLRLLDIRNESYSDRSMVFDIVNSANMRSIDGVTDYSANEAVISAVAGIPSMTEPYELNGRSVTAYCAPMNYTDAEKACVLVCIVDSTFFEETFKEVSLGDSCAVYVKNENEIIAGQPAENSGIYSAAAEVKGCNSWILCVDASISELMPDLTAEIISAVVLSALLAALLCIIIAAMLSKTLGPIKGLSDRISALADGDFTSPVPKVNSQDESAAIADALSRTVAALNGCVREITTSISSVADGDISEDKAVYAGDFAMIHDALSDVKKTLRAALSRIRRASEAVLDKASKLGESTSYEPVYTDNSEIYNVFENFPDISEQTSKTSAKLEEARKILADEQEKLAVLTEAISAISAHTDDITSVISQIEDISFQTNILALNAAIEASTAGEYGRGFAVVADEVRALAQKSSESAKSTTELVEATVSSIESGTALAKETAVLLEEALLSAEEAADCMNRLEAAANDYSAAAQSAEEMIIQLSLAPRQTSSVNTSDADEIVTEAQRLRRIADAFKT